MQLLKLGLFIIFSFCSDLNAQQINGIVVDNSQNKTPIAYASVFSTTLKTASALIKMGNFLFHSLQSMIHY
jgi:hypothetical protein